MENQIYGNDRYSLPPLPPEWNLPLEEGENPDSKRIIDLPLKGYSTVTYAKEHQLSVLQKNILVFAVLEECHSVLDLINKDLISYQSIGNNEKITCTRDIEEWISHFGELVNNSILNGTADNLKFNEMCYSYLRLIKRTHLFISLETEDLKLSISRLRELEKKTSISLEQSKVVLSSVKWDTEVHSDTMKYLDFTKKHESTKRQVDAILNSDNTPERKYIDLLQIAFYSAHQICLSAIDGRWLHMRDLLAFVFAKYAMQESKFDKLKFDEWPETPGIIFSVFARQSAMELAGAFVAAVAGQIFAADPKDLLFHLMEKTDISETEINHWLNSVFLNLNKKFAFSNLVEFNRDAESLAYKLSYEIKQFFTETKVFNKVISTDVSDTNMSIEGEWSKPMGKSKMMSALGMSSYKKFNAFAQKHGIREAGNRQTFQIRLDEMDKATRGKLEKA